MNRTLTPWVVLAAHRPLYIDSDWDDVDKADSDQNVAMKMQEGLEDVMVGREGGREGKRTQGVATWFLTYLYPFSQRMALQMQYKVDLGLYGHHQ